MICGHMQLRKAAGGQQGLGSSNKRRPWGEVKLNFRGQCGGVPAMAVEAY